MDKNQIKIELRVQIKEYLRFILNEEKRQLDEGFDNYRSFLLYIRKEWENHINDALRQYAPTLTYQIDGQEINIPNRVSSSSYKQYNLDHGTFYIAEPKLGVGNQNNTPEWLRVESLINLT